MTTPTRDELIYLREVEGMTRDQIAKHYTVSLTTVRRWIKDLNIPRPSHSSGTKLKNTVKRVGTVATDPDYGKTVMEIAQELLGPRLTERVGVGYVLDGRPSSTAAIIKAAGLKFKDEK